MQPSMGTLNSLSSRVVKDSTPSRRRILRYIIFGIGESSPILFLDMMNLHLITFEAWWFLNERALYRFIIFFFFKWILTWKKRISLVNLHPTLFLRWWILAQLFWKWGELMMKPDLTILLKRWRKVKTWGGFDACINKMTKVHVWGAGNTHFRCKTGRGKTKRENLWQG